MILYATLWETMVKYRETTYTLHQYKGAISSSIIRWLEANEFVSTNTLDTLYKILECTLDNMAVYLPDNK